jgi:hypothetical protein
MCAVLKSKYHAGERKRKIHDLIVVGSALMGTVFEMHDVEAGFMR